MSHKRKMKMQGLWGDGKRVELAWTSHLVLSFLELTAGREHSSHLSLQNCHDKQACTWSLRQPQCVVSESRRLEIQHQGALCLSSPEATLSQQMITLPLSSEDLASAHLSLVFLLLETQVLLK